MQENVIKNDKRTPNAAEYLNGVSPRTRGLEKQRRVIHWIYRWGYSSSEIIRQVAGQMAKGYAKGLAEKGLLLETKTESGSPRFFYTLSESGLQEAERFADELNRYPEIDPYRVNQQQIRHYLLAQQATINTINSGDLDNFRTERMFDAVGDLPGVKRPDVVFLSKSGVCTAVEIELSAKWERHLDQFVLRVAKALSEKDGGPIYDRFAIATDSPAIKRRYEAAMQPGAELPLWVKTDRGRWEIEKTGKVPNWLLEKIDFVLMDV